MRRAMLLWHGAACAALALSACKQEPELRQEPPVTPPGEPARPGVAPQEPAAPGAKVDDIKDSPERFYGKSLRVAGEVNEVYSDRAFELEGGGWFADRITVLTKTPVNIGGVHLAKDDEIVVFGTVRPFVAAEVERDIGWNIGPDVQTKIGKRPVIVADSIRRVGEYGMWSATAAPDAPLSSILMIVTTFDPKTLAGRKVDLGRERVQAITGKGMWVGPSGMSEVFVLPAQSPPDMKVGDHVRVIGTLQRAPKDAAKAWNLPSRMEGMVTDEMVFVDQATVTKVAAAPAGKPAEQPGKQNIQ